MHIMYILIDKIYNSKLPINKKRLIYKYLYLYPKHIVYLQNKGGDIHGSIT